MNDINGNEAIRLLRTLIPPTTHAPPAGPAIPTTEVNVECGAHALTAAFAFAMCGCKTRIAKGRAIVFLNQEAMPVLNHYFVVRADNGTVFDSSITVPLPPLKSEVKFGGIAFDGCPDYPGLEVGLRQANPSGDELNKLFERGKSSPVVVYVADDSWPPEEMIERKVESGFGKWVEQLFGSQFGIWPRFGWVIAEALNSGDTEGILDRGTLIEMVKRTPAEVVHKVRTRCRKLR